MRAYFSRSARRFRDRFADTVIRNPFPSTNEISMYARVALPILMIALLGGCVSQGTYNKEVQQADVLSAQNKTYQALNAQLQSEVQADQVRIKQLEGRLTVTLIDEIVFNSGSAFSFVTSRRSTRR